MTRFHATSRRAMTLIELLVVISLILVLSSLALLISPRLAEDQRSVRAADQVSGWLLICKQRAYRDQQVRGVRLVRDLDDPTQVKELVYIERPEDYRGGVLYSPSPVPPPAGFPASATAFVRGKDLTNQADPTNPIVQPGDFLVFDTLETIPYNSHLIWQMQYIPNGPGILRGGGTHLVLANGGGTRPSRLNSDQPIVAMGSDQFRFVRQPRPMAGEPALQLPRDMIIDITPDPAVGPSLGFSYLPARPNSASVPPGDWLDIMFSPRGQLFGSNSMGGKVVLRLRNGTRPATDGDQNYVVIYTRAGLITTHPVNVTPGASGAIDYYLFLKDGNTSGF